MFQIFRGLVPGFVSWVLGLFRWCLELSCWFLYLSFGCLDLSFGCLVIFITFWSEKETAIKLAASAASLQGGCASSWLDHALKFYVIQGVVLAADLFTDSRTAFIVFFKDWIGGVGMGWLAVDDGWPLQAPSGGFAMCFAETWRVEIWTCWLSDARHAGVIDFFW